MKRFASILAILAAVLLTDVHWSVMQSVSWFQMIQQSPSEISLAETVISTISGHLPCDHCKALQEGRTAEQEKEFAFLAKGHLLLPIASEKTSLSHLHTALFDLLEPVPLRADPAVLGIDRPPQV